MAAAQAPQSAQIATFRTWKCHECGAGPHSITTQTRCSGTVASTGRPCVHDVCSKCPKNDSVPPPLTTKEDWKKTKDGIRADARRSALPLAGNITAPTLDNSPQLGVVAHTLLQSNTGRFQPAVHPSLLRSEPRSGRYLPTQDMRGWWLCCHCNSHMNPRLASQMCSICGHIRCGICRPLG